MYAPIPPLEVAHLLMICYYRLLSDKHLASTIHRLCAFAFHYKLRPTWWNVLLLTNPSFRCIHPVKTSPHASFIPSAETMQIWITIPRSAMRIARSGVRGAPSPNILKECEHQQASKDDKHELELYLDRSIMECKPRRCVRSSSSRSLCIPDESLTY